MKKVVLLAPTPPPIGGIASWTERMLKASLPNGWQVQVVDEKIIGKRVFFGDKTKIDIQSEIKRCFRIWKGLNDALSDKQVKIVHACIAANTMPVLREYISACITKVRGRKFIIHFRCTIPNMIRGRFNKFVLRLLCNKSDCVMILNKQSEKYIKCITKTNTALIPNYVNSDEIVESHKIRNEIKRILYVGGVVESKGCLDIVEVAKCFPAIEFRLIGNPEESCKKAVSQMPNVTLIGPLSHEEIGEEMKEADIFLFLTFFPGEGFSNSLAEAMAAGLPCIVTDWAANKDMLGKNGGIVVPIHGIEEVCRAINKMNSTKLRKKCSEHNIIKIRKEYTDLVVQKQYVECYEGLLR